MSVRHASHLNPLAGPCFDSGSWFPSLSFFPPSSFFPLFLFLGTPFPLFYFLPFPFFLASGAWTERGSSITQKHPRRVSLVLQQVCFHSLLYSFVLPSTPLSSPNRHRQSSRWAQHTFIFTVFNLRARLLPRSRNSLQLLKCYTDREAKQMSTTVSTHSVTAPLASLSSSAAAAASIIPETCVSQASILRCYYSAPGSELHHILLIIPVALELIFSTSLIFTNWRSGR